MLLEANRGKNFLFKRGGHICVALSLSISYLAAQNLIIHGSVTNVFGRQNIFGYEYPEQPDTNGFYDGRAITLPAPRFIFVGIFLTLSKQQTLNQMQSL